MNLLPFTRNTNFNKCPYTEHSQNNKWHLGSRFNQPTNQIFNFTQTGHMDHKSVNIRKDYIVYICNATPLQSKQSILNYVDRPFRVYIEVTYFLFILQDIKMWMAVFLSVKCMFLHKTSQCDRKAKLLCIIASAQCGLREVIWKLLTPVFVGKWSHCNKPAKYSTQCMHYTRDSIHAKSYAAVPDLQLYDPLESRGQLNESVIEPKTKCQPRTGSKSPPTFAW